MKCPMCNGSGKCYEQKIRYQEIETNRTNFTIAKCHKCNGTGEVEMTNEEWLRTLPTDERVKEILSRGFMTEKRTAEDFVEWLKEKHK